MTGFDASAVGEQKRRELRPYLKFVRNLDPETSLETRIEHVVYDAFEDGIGWLREALSASGVSAGVSVPAVYLETDATVREAVRGLVDANCDVVAHGYRHTSYMETPYETATAEMAAIAERFEAELGVRPTGFHVPFMRCSPGTVRAAEEHGIEWIVGVEPDVDTSISFVRPESPYDLQLYERGCSGPEVGERLSGAADGGGLLLCHPNVHAAHDARESFTDFLARESFAAPNALAVNGADRSGLLLDCFPPFRVR